MVEALKAAALARQQRQGAVAAQQEEKKGGDVEMEDLSEAPIVTGKVDDNGEEEEWGEDDQDAWDNYGEEDELD